MYLSLVISLYYDIFTVLLTEADFISKGDEKCKIIFKRAAMPTLWRSRKTRSALLHMLPSRFKGWREVLHAEIGDISKRNGMEQDILA
jgi:hypothetical protein